MPPDGKPNTKLVDDVAAKANLPQGQVGEKQKEIKEAGESGNLIATTES